jgi:hypothetical protein
LPHRRDGERPGLFVDLAIHTTNQRDGTGKEKL